MQFLTHYKNSTKSYGLQNSEVKTVRGLPELKILGLNPTNITSTITETIQTAYKSSQFKLPAKRKIIKSNLNLNPNNYSYDYASELSFTFAVHLLFELNLLKKPQNLPVICFGTLHLDGSIRQSGNINQLKTLISQNPKTLFLIAGDYDFLHPNIIKVSHLKDLKNIQFFNFVPSSNQLTQTTQKHTDTNSLNKIQDLDLAKYALLLTLKQQSSLLLIGASGIGKTMLFNSLESLQIPFNQIIHFDSSYTVSQFKKKINELEQNTSLKQVYYLIFNELNDYSKSFLEYLKIFFDQQDTQTLTHTYSLLMSLNPCPCGNLNHPTKLCMCNPYQISRYNTKIPFPLLDRIDLVLNLNTFPTSDLNILNIPSVTHSSILKALSKPSSSLNKIDPFAKHLLESLNLEFQPSIRRQKKITKLASTISSLQNTSTSITQDSMSAAIVLNTSILAQSLPK